MNLGIYKKNNTSWPSRVYPRNSNWVKCLKQTSKQTNNVFHHIKRIRETYDHFNTEKAFNKSLHPFSREWKVFPTNGDKTTCYSYRKQTNQQTKNQNLNRKLHYTQTLRRILDLNVKCKIMKFLEENKRSSSWPKSRSRWRFSR